MKARPLSRTALCMSSLACAAMSGAPHPATAQASASERAYAERVAMQAIDARCRLLPPEAAAAQAAFVAQARGGLLRAGTPDARLELIAGQARQAAARKPCNDPAVRGEAQRVAQAFSGWRAQMAAEYPGPTRTWRASRAGADAWRAWQDLGQGVRAGFVGSAGNVQFAVETPDTTASGSRAYVRDMRRIGPPVASARPAPAPRAGATVHLAARRLPAVTRARIDAPPRPGTLLVFPATATQAIANADPRDLMEIEIVGRTGGVQRLLLEVGDISAAYAFAAT